MPSDIALLSPFNTGPAVELSRSLWRKQILKKGTINYKDNLGRTRKITFDDAYLSDLAKSFKEGAYDQVAFQLADANNTHTYDPERFRGDIKGVEVASDGLYAYLDPTPEGAELLRKNPKLGVSARIMEGLEHADGRKFPRAIHHVLGTLDPKVTGLGSWQEVALAEEAGDTIDITKEEVTTLSDTSTTTGGGGGTSPPAPASTEETEATSESAVATIAPPGTTNVNINVSQPAGTSKDPAPVMDVGDDEDFDFDIVTDEEIEAAAASLSNSTAGTPSSSEVALAKRVQDLELELAQQRFDSEAKEYVSKGVPPALVELARPVLSLPAAPVIDLSNNEHIDVARLFREMLDQTQGFIQLSREQGTSESGDPDKDEADNVLANWRGGKK